MWKGWIDAYFFMRDFPGAFGSKSYLEQDWLYMNILLEIRAMHIQITKSK